MTIGANSDGEAVPSSAAAARAGGHISRLRFIVRIPKWHSNLIQATIDLLWDVWGTHDNWVHHKDHLWLRN